MFHRMMNYGDQQQVDTRPTFVLTRELIKRTMPKYKRHDDLILVQEPAWEEFKRQLPIPVVRQDNSPFSIDEDELASLVCQTVQKPICRRLAVERGVKDDDYRTPNVELILGESGLVTHKENHLIYRFDVTKCMFSFGNINEKMRMAELDCSSEIVVDLFAGIGYFTLPLLVHAKAKHLYACEWNPAAVEALKENLILNKVDGSRYTVIEGDNRCNRPTDVAQRVILGILPSSMGWLQTAFECVNKTTGAILHCHDLVEAKPEDANSIADQQLNISTDNEDQPLASKHQQEETANSSTPSLSNNDLTINAATCMNNTGGQQAQLSVASSSSSSQLEKIENIPTTATTNDGNNRQRATSESDKDTTCSSPVFLEKPASICSIDSNASPERLEAPLLNNVIDTSSGSLNSNQEDINSIHELEPPQVSNQELNAYELRAQQLIDCIREEVEAHDLKISLLLIRPVKSYAPHINHVVFDIKIEPKRPVLSAPPEPPS